jgi:hypothetical protein
MKRLACLLAAASITLTACETTPDFFRPKSAEPVAEFEPVDSPTYTSPSPDTGLPLAPEQRFQDIPLPVGVKEDLDRTFVFENSSFRVGRMVYTSKSTINELAQFYLNESRAADWQNQSTIQADQGVEMTFAKPGYRLKVDIKDLGFTRGRRLVIMLTPDSAL